MLECPWSQPFSPFWRLPPRHYCIDVSFTVRILLSSRFVLSSCRLLFRLSLHLYHLLPYRLSFYGLPFSTDYLLSCVVFILSSSRLPLIVLSSFCHRFVDFMLPFRGIVSKFSAYQAWDGGHCSGYFAWSDCCIAAFREICSSESPFGFSFLPFFRWKQIARIYHVFWPHEREDPVARTVLRFSCKYKI